MEAFRLGLWIVFKNACLLIGVLSVFALIVWSWHFTAVKIFFAVSIAVIVICIGLAAIHEVGANELERRRRL